MLIRFQAFFVVVDVAATIAFGTIYTYSGGGPSVVPGKQIGACGINQCGSGVVVCAVVVPVAATYRAGVVGWRIPYRHYAGTTAVPV